MKLLRKDNQIQSDRHFSTYQVFQRNIQEFEYLKVQQSEPMRTC